MPFKMNSIVRSLQSAQSAVHIFVPQVHPAVPFQIYKFHCSVESRKLFLSLAATTCPFQGGSFHSLSSTICTHFKKVSRHRRSAIDPIHFGGQALRNSLGLPGPFKGLQSTSRIMSAIDMHHRGPFSFCLVNKY